MRPWLILIGLAVGLALGLSPERPPLQAQGASLLQEGGFEGGLGPWRALRGELSRVTAPVHGGSYAAALTAQGTAWAYQEVAIAPGGSYTFSGWALKDAAPGASLFLRLSWYSGDGEPLGYVDSDEVIAGDEPRFRFLSLGPTPAPLRAGRAQVRVVLSSPETVTVYLDDLELLGPLPSPTPEPARTPTPTATPTPAALPTPTPFPTSTPVPTPTPSPVPAARPSPTSTPSPTPTPVPSPLATSIPTPGNPSGPTPQASPALPATGEPGLRYWALMAAGLGLASLALGAWAWRRGRA